MTHTIEIDDMMIIPIDRFDNEKHIEERVLGLEQKEKEALTLMLRYLYFNNAPKNVPYTWKKSIGFLEPREEIVFKWLKSRITGRLRNIYGNNSIITARTSKYRCKLCGNGDVRVLNLDHIEGRNKKELFQVLCANCHMIKSRDMDWTGKKREEI